MKVMTSLAEGQHRDWQPFTPTCMSLGCVGGSEHADRAHGDLDQADGQVVDVNFGPSCSEQQCQPPNHRSAPNEDMIVINQEAIFGQTSDDFLFLSDMSVVCISHLVTVNSTLTCIHVHVLRNHAHSYALNNHWNYVGNKWGCLQSVDPRFTYSKWLFTTKELWDALWWQAKPSHVLLTPAAYPQQVCSIKA